MGGGWTLVTVPAWLSVTIDLQLGFGVQVNLTPNPARPCPASTIRPSLSFGAQRGIAVIPVDKPKFCEIPRNRCQAFSGHCRGEARLFTEVDAEPQAFRGPVFGRLVEPFDQAPAVREDDALRRDVGCVGRDLYIWEPDLPRFREK